MFSDKGKGKGKEGKGKDGKGKGKDGKGKGKGGKGKERQAPPEYDPSTPCGYSLAGYCRFHCRGRCIKQHSVPYAMAIRHEWLNPESADAKDALKVAAEEALGAAATAGMFPRVFSEKLRLCAPCAPAGSGQWGARQGDTGAASAGDWGARWGHADETSTKDDGFAWEEEDNGPGAAAGDSRSSGHAARPADEGPPRYLLILDLEGKDEIIEFPVIALDTQKGEEVGRFQRYVRPLRLFEGCPINPDSPAVPFPAVLRDFDRWLWATLGTDLESVGAAGSQAAFLTCGDWDCKHVHTQCGISGVPVPPAFRRWVNIKRSYSEAYGGEFRGMKSMLARLRLLDREGNVKHGFHHLGMHDVENIGRCALHLLREGVAIRVNGWMRGPGRGWT